MKSLLASLRPIWRELALWGWEWAHREMGGAHPDTPEVVRNIHRLRSERAASR